MKEKSHFDEKNIFMKLPITVFFHRRMYTLVDMCLSFWFPRRFDFRSHDYDGPNFKLIFWGLPEKCRKSVLNRVDKKKLFKLVRFFQLSNSRDETEWTTCFKPVNLEASNQSQWSSNNFVSEHIVNKSKISIFLIRNIHDNILSHSL